MVLYMGRTRNYKYEQERKLSNFFSRMFVMAKKLELFASTLNGITASVRCVSSIIVVLNAKLTQLIEAHTNKKDSEERKSPTRVPFFAR